MNIPKLDLLVIDIDDTFIYHRTVAQANRLFLENVYSFFNRKLDQGLYTTWKTIILAMLALFNFHRVKFDKEVIRRIFMLKIYGICLHLLNMVRTVNNYIFRVMSSERMIRHWAETVVGLRIRDYGIPKEIIQRNLDKGIVEIYNKIRKGCKVLAISQSFIMDKDPIKDILKIDYLECNRLVRNKDLITGYFLNVKNGKDKREIAEKIISKTQAGSIGLIIEDWDDIELLRLKNVVYVLTHKRLKRFIDRNVFYKYKSHGNFISYLRG